MDMIKIQSRLVKSSLGLKKYFHSTPLLAALFTGAQAGGAKGEAAPPQQKKRERREEVTLKCCNCLIQLWVTMPELKNSIVTC